LYQCAIFFNAATISLDLNGKHLFLVHFLSYIYFTVSLNCLHWTTVNNHSTYTPSLGSKASLNVLLLQLKFLNFRFCSRITSINPCQHSIYPKLFCQQTHSLLKYKMLQLALKISLYMTPTCFGPFRPSSGSR
jgi:hypothetical protein